MNVRTVIAALLVAASVLLVPTQAQAGAADEGSLFVSGQLGLNYYLKNSSPEVQNSNTAMREMAASAVSEIVGPDCHHRAYWDPCPECAFGIPSMLTGVVSLLPALSPSRTSGGVDVNTSRQSYRQSGWLKAVGFVVPAAILAAIFATGG